MGPVEASDLLEFLGHHAILIASSLFAFLVLNLVLTVIVFRDARNRGLSAPLWALMTLIFSLLALFIYILVRPPAEGSQCLNCGQSLEPPWKICPACNTPVPAAASLLPQASPQAGQAMHPPPRVEGPGRPTAAPTIADAEDMRMPVLAWVVGLTGPVKGKRFDLVEGENLFGRDPNARFSVNSQKVSARHARLTWKGEAFTIEDCGSTNGTFLNDLPLQPEEPQVLENGDDIRLGREIRFKFVKVTAEP